MQKTEKAKGDPTNCIFSIFYPNWLGVMVFF